MKSKKTTTESSNSGYKYMEKRENTKPSTVVAFNEEPEQSNKEKENNEINYIVKGELIVSKKHLKTGDMWIYEPNEVSDVEFLSDVDLIVVRWPSIPSDKYIA